MQVNMDRIQTTHVGSLVRPPELVDFMRKRLEREAVDDAAYERYLTSAVAHVVERQAAVGLTVVNDGEYPKSSWYLTSLSGSTASNTVPFLANGPSPLRRPAWISSAFAISTPSIRAGNKPMRAAGIGS